MLERWWELKARDWSRADRQDHYHVPGTRNQVACGKEKKKKNNLHKVVAAGRSCGRRFLPEIAARTRSRDRQNYDCANSGRATAGLYAAMPLGITVCRRPSKRYYTIIHSTQALKRPLQVICLFDTRLQLPYETEP